jgi:hypothetical protein
MQSEVLQSVPTTISQRIAASQCQKEQLELKSDHKIFLVSLTGRDPFKDIIWSLVSGRFSGHIENRLDLYLKLVKRVQTLGLLKIQSTSFFLNHRCISLQGRNRTSHFIVDTTPQLSETHTRQKPNLLLYSISRDQVMNDSIEALSL